MHQHNEAELNLRRSIKTNPAQIGAHAELAMIYMEQEELTRARDLLKQGLEVDSEAPELLAILSLTYIQGGDLRNAEKYLEQAEESDDEHELVEAVRTIFNDEKAKQHTTPKPKFKQRKKRK